MKYRFHILGIPHTASNEEWLACAFTQKIVKLCRMLTRRGHEVIHYGNSASVVEAENIAVTGPNDLGPPDKFLEYDIGGSVYRKFTDKAAREITLRKRTHDFLLCMWGAGHRAIADAVGGDLIVVEPGIGYPGGSFAPFKVFESYAILHAYYGLEAVGTAGKVNWYDAVIPNAFDPTDFLFEPHKQDYLLFLGRIGEAKGIHVAREVAEAVKMPLHAFGPGGEIVGREKRRQLLAGARALIAPSTFVEPFCGVVTEAHFSGTPTITSDWGAMTENNLNGITGWRCRTLEEFIWAAQHLDDIDPYICNQWAHDNFSLTRVGDMYEEYFSTVMRVFDGDGWYQTNPTRQKLDRTSRFYPVKESHHVPSLRGSTPRRSGIL